MTVIAAMVHDGVVTFSADSGATDSNGLRYKKIRKLLRLEWDDDYALVACAGPVGLRQMFASGIISVDEGPDPRSEADSDDWAQSIARAVTEVCAESRPPMLSGDQLEGDVLLAHRGRLWTLDVHSALRVPEYASIGSGDHLALGAMTVLHPMVRRRVITAREATRAAVGAAIEWCASCHGEIHTDTT